DLCKMFLNAPYLWGGKNPLGIDCSGFVQVIYKILGIKLPRDAGMQVALGQTINFIGEVTTGDLAFFDDEEGTIIHMGIILNKEEIIHASGKVRIDKFDHQGIFNQEKKEYTYKLRIIKRLI
ncbi:MAG: C40 family peptidase, partial [Bacteroidota bacterium]